MRRGEPPRRKTPLRRSTKPLKRVALKLSSKPLPKRSKKKLAALGDDEFRVRCAARVYCEAPELVGRDAWWRENICPGRAIQHLGNHAHHVLPRSRGGKHDAERNGLWLCAYAHSWAHSHPARARELGLLR